MNIYIAITVLVTGILILGLGMFMAARWSRKRNEVLKARQEDSQAQALKDMLQGKKGSVANFYTSSLSRPGTFIGNALAVGVIIFFIIFALVMAYYGWTRT